MVAYKINHGQRASGSRSPIQVKGGRNDGKTFGRGDAYETLAGVLALDLTRRTLDDRTPDVQTAISKTSAGEIRSLAWPEMRLDHESGVRRAAGRDSPPNNDGSYEL